MTQLTKLDNIKRDLFNPKTTKGFEALLPKNFDVKQFSASLWLEIQNNSKLQECDNIIDLARDCANFGLLPNGLAGQCYFIPFGKKAKLIIGYKGYITKLEEAGYTIECELVTKEEVEQDRFEEVRGSEVKIIHKPLRTGIRNKDNIALAYAIVRKKDLQPIITVLSVEEIEEIAKTEKWTNGVKTRQLGNVWTQNQRQTDFGQMCLKTVIRNVAKKVNLAIANEMSAYEGKRDEEMKDVTPKSDNFFENQLNQAKQNNLSDEEKAEIDKMDSDVIESEIVSD
jgi:phage RecT family recombinase